MSKSEAISGLIESALEEFSRHGYEGASLREIAAGAGVPLSTIDRYFGTKVELYAAVEQHVWNQINDERDRLLTAALEVDPPRLDAIIRALTAPVVSRAVGDEEQRWTVELLRSSVATRRVLGINAPTLRGQARMSRRLVDAIRRTLPHLSQSRSTWAYSFAIGSLYSWQLMDRFYDGLMPDEPDPSPEAVTDLLVAFICGGLQALDQAG